MKPEIGLNNEKKENLALTLNTLLATESVFYQNLRQFHWYVKGPRFFALHEKFEELYNTSNAYIDEVAERILTLGGQPLSSLTQFVSNSKIGESKEKNDADAMVNEVLASLKTLSEMERSILEEAGEAKDEGTVGLISGSLEMREKTIWMLTALLS